MTAAESYATMLRALATGSRGQVAGLLNAMPVAIAHSLDELVALVERHQGRLIARAAREQEQEHRDGEGSRA